MRFKIKQMIDAEASDAILSDDAIVERLKAQDIDIARRTVAKYRESLKIPSSVERRREKQASRTADRGAGSRGVTAAAITLASSGLSACAIDFGGGGF